MKMARGARKFSWKKNIDNDLCKLGIARRKAKEVGSGGQEAVEANGQIVGCRLKPRKFDDDTVTDGNSPR